MSTPTMNHSSFMQQQQQPSYRHPPPPQTNEVQPACSNLANSVHAPLTRSDSTLTVILEDEETRPSRRNGLNPQPPTSWVNLSLSLRSLLKISGRFNGGFESDKLDELLAGENGFTLQRLLSEFSGTDFNIDANNMIKIDSQTLSEFLRSESFDQLIASVNSANDMPSHPSAMPCSSSSFSELRNVSPELITHDFFPDPSALHTDNALLYTDINTANSVTVYSSAPAAYSQLTLNAIDHDHAFLPKREAAAGASSTGRPKASAAQTSRRASSRLQSRAACTSTSAIHTGSLTGTKRTRSISRATDIQTPEDLSYYLERRRKNNEASKVSRAARKQKFGSMDEHCEEYERENEELRRKISTLESVTRSLKSGLVHSFQQKTN